MDKKDFHVQILKRQLDIRSYLIRRVRVQGYYTDWNEFINKKSFTLINSIPYSRIDEFTSFVRYAKSWYHNQGLQWENRLYELYETLNYPKKRKEKVGYMSSLRSLIDYYRNNHDIEILLYSKLNRNKMSE